MAWLESNQNKTKIRQCGKSSVCHIWGPRWSRGFHGTWAALLSYSVHSTDSWPCSLHSTAVAVLGICPTSVIYRNQTAAWSILLLGSLQGLLPGTWYEASASHHGSFTLGFTGGCTFANGLSRFLTVPSHNLLLQDTKCGFHSEIHSWPPLDHRFCVLTWGKHFQKNRSQWCWSLTTSSYFLSPSWPASAVPVKQRFHFGGAGLFITTESSVTADQTPQILNSN